MQLVEAGGEGADEVWKVDEGVDRRRVLGDAAADLGVEGCDVGAAQGILLEDVRVGELSSPTRAYRTLILYSS